MSETGTHHQPTAEQQYTPIPYGAPFAAFMLLPIPSTHSYKPPKKYEIGSGSSTDPKVVTCFNLADQDGNGFIDDKELQRFLSSDNQIFSLRIVHLLMYHITNTNTRVLGPMEFTSLLSTLQYWTSIFQRFDKDRSGKIDSSQLEVVLQSLGFSVSPVTLDLLVSKFDKSGGVEKVIEYDNFVGHSLTCSRRRKQTTLDQQHSPMSL
ncbi:hypothetical protein AQUCO_01400601v1 [Aquilegia coerulea]|uniref:EF-hand domain-containing protein n=1 Tax=Aquilegia coerulea TaxID=218851 RepID=A0A2G5DX77_AQUCA|nr:hypothetical protein AQUCO_01400601v1 [Aquilegia coerulea]